VRRGLRMDQRAPVDTPVPRDVERHERDQSVIEQHVRGGKRAVATHGQRVPVMLVTDGDERTRVQRDTTGGSRGRRDDGGASITRKKFAR